MRLKNKITYFLLPLIFIGCIKERGNNFANQTTPVANTVGFVNQYEAAALDISSTPSNYTFNVYLSSTDNSYPATQVTIAKDNSAVSAYNTAHPDNPPFEALPDSAYTIVNSTATVDPKTHIAAFVIKVSTTKISLTHNYALGFAITSATGATIATNVAKTVIAVSLKNKYDGIYELRGSVLRAGDPVLSGRTGPTEIPLVTYGPTSVLWDASVPWANGSGSTLPGGYNPIITVNANNTLSVVSSGGIGGWTMDPSYNNRYDPATKKIYFQFFWGAGPGSRLSTDTLTYLRPR